MLLLKQNTTKKRRMDKEIRQNDFDISNSNGKRYKIRAICDSAIFVRWSEDYLLELYYLILWKGYLEKKTPVSLI